MSWVELAIAGAVVGAAALVIASRFKANAELLASVHLFLSTFALVAAFMLPCIVGFLYSAWLRVVIGERPPWNMVGRTEEEEE